MVFPIVVLAVIDYRLYCRRNIYELSHMKYILKRVGEKILFVFVLPWLQYVEIEEKNVKNLKLREAQNKAFLIHK